MTSTDRLIARLSELNYSEEFVRAALPEWWTPEEEGSPSAELLVKLLLATELNLDPQSLLDDDAPLSYLSSGNTKFMHLRLPPGERYEALTGFARGISRITLAAMGGGQLPPERLPSALEMRESVLKSGRPHVEFGDVLTLCWSLNIPVMHLRLFPAKTKGITAMSVKVGGGFAILIARETGAPAQYMFHVAHELGHIALGHLDELSAIVDADPLDPDTASEQLIADELEAQADVFAQQLLSGRSDFRVLRDAPDDGRRGGTPRELAYRAIQAGQQLAIDPGHVVMS